MTKPRLACLIINYIPWPLLMTYFHDNGDNLFYTTTTSIKKALICKKLILEIHDDD